jgi:hypothetical protein
MIESIYLTQVKDLDLLEDLCQELLSILDQDLSRTPVDHPITFNNSDIFIMDTPVIQKFIKEVVEPEFEKYVAVHYDKKLSELKHYYKSWVAMYTNGRHQPIHNHPSSTISSVIYLLSNNEGGEIEFIEDTATSLHAPVTGDFVIFPSRLHHEVKRYTGKLRLALPVDLYIL